MICAEEGGLGVVLNVRATTESKPRTLPVSLPDIPWLERKGECHAFTRVGARGDFHSEALNCRGFFVCAFSQPPGDCRFLREWLGGKCQIGTTVTRGSTSQDARHGIKFQAGSRIDPDCFRRFISPFKLRVQWPVFQCHSEAAGRTAQTAERDAHQADSQDASLCLVWKHVFSVDFVGARASGMIRTNSH